MFPPRAPVGNVSAAAGRAAARWGARPRFDQCEVVVGPSTRVYEFRRVGVLGRGPPLQKRESVRIVVQPASDRIADKDPGVLGAQVRVVDVEVDRQAVIAAVVERVASGGPHADPVAAGQVAQKGARVQRLAPHRGEVHPTSVVVGRRPRGDRRVGVDGVVAGLVVSGAIWRFVVKEVVVVPGDPDTTALRGRHAAQVIRDPGWVPAAHPHRHVVVVIGESGQCGRTR